MRAAGVRRVQAMRVAAAVVVAVLVSACGDVNFPQEQVYSEKLPATAARDRPGPAAGTWVWGGLVIDGEEFVIPDEQLFQVTDVEGSEAFSLTGKPWCNSLSFVMGFAGGQMEAESAFTTEIACWGDALIAENQLFNTLGGMTFDLEFTDDAMIWNGRAKPEYSDAQAAQLVWHYVKP